MNKLMTIAVLFAAVTAHGQITNVGYGLAGFDVNAPRQAYNIRIDATGRFIILNGIWYPIQLTSQQNPAVCNVILMGKPSTAYGNVSIKSADGTQTLAGEIHVKKTVTKDGENGTWTATYDIKSFAVAAYKGALTKVTRQQITVMVRDPNLGIFVVDPNRTIWNLSVRGTMWLNQDLSLHSAVFDTLSENGISQLNIIPAPGGFNVPTLPGVYPTKVR